MIRFSGSRIPKVILASACIAGLGSAGAQTRQILFDGKTLAGWHTQGEGVWTVKDGNIQALNPKRNWAHLITDQGFGNGYVRLKFLNKVGNSGLYVRGAGVGVHGMTGMQVDFGTDYDGAVMRVTETTWAWLEEATLSKAKDSGWTRAGQWNELAVDMQGTGLKTYINGKLVWQGANVSGMAAAGQFGIQLHSGDANDIWFKDVEVLLPARVPHCPIPSDPAYKPGNDPDTRLCRNPVGIAAQGARVAASPVMPGMPGFFAAPRFWNGGSRFDLKGARPPGLFITHQTGD